MKPLASQFSASVGYLPAIVRAYCRASDFIVTCRLANEASTTSSTFSERDESNTETLVKTTYNTSYSYSPIDVPVVNGGETIGLNPVGGTNSSRAKSKPRKREIDGSSLRLSSVRRVRKNFRKISRIRRLFLDADFAWDKRRARERAFAEYGAEDAEPELNEASLRAIAREGRESSENTDFLKIISI